MYSQSRSISLGFVLFKAEPSLVERIRLASQAGFQCYIFDNSPEDETFNEVFNNKQNCKYITTGKNAGLGVGISCVCGQSYYDKFKALLFFDQDTVFDISTLEFANDFYESNQSLGNEYSSICFKSKKNESARAVNGFFIKDVLLTISSGSLFYLDRLKDINWHNHSYFVDCVDYEFCLNSNNHNLKLAECYNSPGFDHVSEQADSEYTFLGKKMMLRKYSSFRVRGTIVASIRLFVSALCSFNLRYTYAIFRSLLIYV
ncbi:MAG: glycosyltransferase, partial [Flavobacterium sp.]